MRDRKGWMNKATDPVLELLAEGNVLNVKSIWLTLRKRQGETDAPGEETIRRGLKEMNNHGYVNEQETKGKYYVITDKGVRYLAEEQIEV